MQAKNSPRRRPDRCRGVTLSHHNPLSIWLPGSIKRDAFHPKPVRFGCVSSNASVSANGVVDRKCRTFVVPEVSLPPVSCGGSGTCRIKALATNFLLCQIESSRRIVWPADKPFIVRCPASIDKPPIFMLKLQHCRETAAQQRSHFTMVLAGPAMDEQPAIVLPAGGLDDGDWKDGGPGASPTEFCMFAA